MHIEFLHQNIYGVGGTVRSVINLANALAVDHEVTITSVFRRVESPSLFIDPRVEINALVDMREKGADRGDTRHNRPSIVVPAAEEYFRQYSELTDARLIDHLRISQADVIVGTRPSLNLLVAEFGNAEATLVAQEHMTHSAIPRTVVLKMREVYQRLQLVTTVTAADRLRVMASLNLPEDRVRVLVNSVPEPVLPPTTHDTHLIFAVGRLAPEKRYDRLIQAFATARQGSSEWRLRIYGDGPSRGALENRATELGVRAHIDFMGASQDMDSEWPLASLLVSTSERESFGMSIVEGMRSGVPVISTDCPDGPREIITHEVDGILVPLNDADVLAKSLAHALHTPAWREKIGAAALASSARYAPPTVAQAFARMLDDVGARRRHRSFAEILRRWWPATKPRVVAPAKQTVQLTMPSVRDVQVHGAPAGAFWKNAAGVRLELGDDATTDVSRLGNGIWNLHAPLSGNRSKRLGLSSIDSRALVRQPPMMQTGLSWAIPYRTFDGFAAVKAWNLPRHAELCSAHWSEHALHISCRLLGRWDPEQDMQLVVSRDEALAAPQTVETAVWDHEIEFTVGTHTLQQLWRLKHETFFVGVKQSADPATPIAAVIGNLPDLRRRRMFDEREILDGAPEDLYHTIPRPRLMLRPMFGRNNALTIRMTER